MLGIFPTFRRALGSYLSPSLPAQLRWSARLSSPNTDPSVKAISNFAPCRPAIVVGGKASGIYVYDIVDSGVPIFDEAVAELYILSPSDGCSSNGCEVPLKSSAIRSTVSCRITGLSCTSVFLRRVGLSSLIQQPFYNIGSLFTSSRV